MTTIAEMDPAILLELNSVTENDQDELEEERVVVKSPHRFGNLVLELEGPGTSLDDEDDEDFKISLKGEEDEDARNSNHAKKVLGARKYQILLRTLKFKPSKPEEMSQKDQQDLLRELSILSLGGKLDRERTRMSLLDVRTENDSPSLADLDPVAERLRALEEMERKAQIDPLWFLTPEEREAYERALKVDELRLSAKSLVTNGQCDIAIDKLSEVLKSEPDRKDCLLARAKCYAETKQPNEALKDCDSYMELVKEDIRPYLLKSEILYNIGEFEQSLVCLHRAKRMKPNSPAIRLAIQRAETAIDAAVGETSHIHLDKSGDLGYFENEEARLTSRQEYIYRRGLRTADRGEDRKQKELQEKEERRKALPVKTVKRLLGELYGDWEYLDQLAKEEESTLKEMGEDDIKEESKKRKRFNSNSSFLTESQQRALDDLRKQRSGGPRGIRRGLSTNLRDLAQSELHYLSDRVEFWQRTTGGKNAKCPSKNTEKALRGILDDMDEITEDQQQGRHEQAISKTQKCLERISRISSLVLKDTSEYQACLHSLMGSSYYELEQYDKAMQEHKKDLAIGEKKKLKDAESRALDHIGQTYAKMGKYTSAVNCFKKKLPLIKDKMEEIWVCHELGRCLLEIKKYNEALEYGQRSLEAAQVELDTSWQMNALILIAQLYAALGDKENARDHYSKASAIAKEDYEYDALEAIDNALKQLGDESELEKKPDSPPPNDTKDEDREPTLEDIRDQIKATNQEEKDAKQNDEQREGEESLADIRNQIKASNSKMEENSNKSQTGGDEEQMSKEDDQSPTVQEIRQEILRANTEAAEETQGKEGDVGKEKEPEDEMVEQSHNLSNQDGGTPNNTKNTEESKAEVKAEEASKEKDLDADGEPTYAEDSKETDEPAPTLIDMRAQILASNEEHKSDLKNEADDDDDFYK